MIVHAGLIARRLGGLWRGALIRGASGSGKSDFALRALETGDFRLAADDRVLVWASDGRLYGRCPEPISGLVEARGLGIESEPCLPLCEIVLAADCRAGGDLDRLPEPEILELLGIDIPLIGLAALQASAPAKLRRALERLGGRADES